MLYNAIKHGAFGCELPPFLHHATRNQFADYFDVSDLFDDLAIGLSVGFDYFTSPFELVWKEFLKNRKFHPVSLIEFGCGSANDYRMWAASGVASLLDYTGVDVSSSNIRNARKRFDEVNFIVGDVCCLDADDEAFDVTVAFDVYEHLSPTALFLALGESLRVTRDECWISLFNADSCSDHAFQEVGDYHWNKLSLPSLADEVRPLGFEVEIYSVPGILESRFDGYRHYNREAHIIVARRKNQKASTR